MSKIAAKTVEVRPSSGFGAKTIVSIALDDGRTGEGIRGGLFHNDGGEVEATSDAIRDAQSKPVD